MYELITDAELLALGLATEALSGIAETVRDAHRLAASSYVVARLSPRFTVPEDWTPGEDTKRAVAALAVESLIGRRGFDPRGGGQADPIGTAARAAREWLRDVLEGRARPTNVDALTELGGPLVAGTDTAAWADWRAGGVCS